VPEVNRILTELGPVWVMLNEYQLTHAGLHLLLLAEGRPRPPDRVADVYMSECISIHSPTMGGPLRLSLATRGDERQPEFVLSDADGLVEIVALRCTLEDRRGT
jgi:hypothetical protein